jgi:MerR family transcriptional regulator, copper efflux regulator
MSHHSLRIGEVAAAAGVQTPTLRFYEKRGLLNSPKRRASGYREYSDDAVRTVRFIKRAQELGFSLREVQELLALRDGARSCAEVRDAAQAKLADVNAKMRRLASMQRALKTLVASCASRRTRNCPILEALDEPSRRPSR